MKVKMIVRRYPFYTTYCSVSEYIRPFNFEPRLFKWLSDEQAKQFGDYLSTINGELKEIKEAYLSLKQRFNVSFIEVHKEIEIGEEELAKIIEYAKSHGLRLLPYTEILPIVSKEQFEKIRKYAKKHGYRKAISKFLQS